MTARPVSQGKALDDWAMVVAASNNSLEYRIDRFIGWMMGKAPLAEKHDVAYKQEQLRIHTSLCFIQAHIRAQHELKQFYRRIDTHVGIWDSISMYLCIHVSMSIV
jgi:hypothetical protein